MTVLQTYIYLEPPPECLAPLIEPKNSNLKITKLQRTHHPASPTKQKNTVVQKEGRPGSGGADDGSGTEVACGLGNQSAAMVGEQVRGCGASTGLEAAVCLADSRQKSKV